MNCTDFELGIHELLDARCSTLPGEFSVHAATCAECRAVWQSQQTLLAATRTWAPVTAPAGLLSAVLSALSLPETNNVSPTLAPMISVSAPPPARGTVWAAWCTTAALLLVAVTMIRLPSQPTEIASRATVWTVSPSELADEALVSQTLTGLWHGMHTEYQELSQETTRVLDGWSELPESATILPVLPAAESSPTSPPPAWMRLTRPVSDRVGQAFDFLRDAVPGETPQSS